MESVWKNRLKVSHCLVLGNGESRKHIDWHSKKYPITIGCNALHRDNRVDHLVCCDRRMAEEACNNPNLTDTLIYVRERNFNYFRKIKKNKNIRVLPDIFYQGELKADQSEHWGSGPYAVLLATLLSNQIHLLGFDLYGICDRVNNIYKNTINYSSELSSAVDYSYWVYQISKIIRYNQNKKFIFFNKENWNMPKDWNFDNVCFERLDKVFLDNKYSYS